MFLNRFDISVNEYASSSSKGEIVDREHATVNHNNTAVDSEYDFVH
jgi:citrate lyase alpha subunit